MRERIAAEDGRTVLGRPSTTGALVALCLLLQPLLPACVASDPHVPTELLGVWRPEVRGLGDRFLEITPTSLAWGSQDGSSEPRRLEAVEELPPVEGRVASFSLRYREPDGSLGKLVISLLADGAAEVGGRRSFHWRREAEQ